MAGLTKDELKSALINHGLEMSLSNVKKDELVELYDKYVAPYDVGEFSSDDEASPTKKKVSRSSKKSTGSAGSKGEKRKSVSNVLTEENSMIVGDIKVNELSDEDLIKFLKEYEIEVGPIVGEYCFATLHQWPL